MSDLRALSLVATLNPTIIFIILIIIFNVCAKIFMFFNLSKKLRFFFDSNNSFLKFHNNNNNFEFYTSNQIYGCFLILIINFFQIY
jgi:hypothetical protein